MIFKSNKENELIRLEAEIFKSIQYFRLEKDLEIVENEIKEYQIEPNVKKYDLIKRFTNYASGIMLEDLEKERTDLIARIEEFKLAMPKNMSYTLFKDNKIQESFNKLYKDDTYALKRYLLAIRVIMDSEYSYKNNDKSFEVISAIMFNNINALKDINKRLKETYLEIAKKPLTQSQKGVLIGLGIASLISVGAVSLLSAAGIAAATAGASAATLAFTELSLIGLAAFSMDTSNISHLKEEFAALTPDESAFFLTLKALLIEEAYSKMPEEKFKESLSDILKIVDDMRSEVSYLLFVEGSDSLVNKEKINQFHNFDKLMIKAFNL